MNSLLWEPISFRISLFKVEYFVKKFSWFSLNWSVFPHSSASQDWKPRFPDVERAGRTIVNLGRKHLSNVMLGTKHLWYVDFILFKLQTVTAGKFNCGFCSKYKFITTEYSRKQVRNSHALKIVTESPSIRINSQIILRKGLEVVPIRETAQTEELPNTFFVTEKTWSFSLSFKLLLFFWTRWMWNSFWTLSLNIIFLTILLTKFSNRRFLNK